MKKWRSFETIKWEVTLGMLQPTETPLVNTIGKMLLNADLGNAKLIRSFFSEEWEKCAKIGNELFNNGVDCIPFYELTYNINDQFQEERFGSFATALSNFLHLYPMFVDGRKYF